MVVSTLDHPIRDRGPASPDLHPLTNDEIADALEHVADLLEAQTANPHRIRAYRRAAHTLRSLETPISEVFQNQGRAGLEALPGIGQGLSAAIAEYLQTGQLRRLEQLQAEVSPEALFTTIPGIGEKLAHHLHQELGIHTLEALELAAQDGRLAGVKGFGPRRTRLVRDALHTMLNRSSRYRAQRRRRQEIPVRVALPPVSLLLEIDQHYRDRATAGKLPAIAPWRFNPDHKRWLPILHQERQGWRFTVLYSNTARAHDLDKTHDWVVIYYERDGMEGQCTVVTETQGKRRGQRVVRGREAECARVDINSAR